MMKTSFALAGCVLAVVLFAADAPKTETAAVVGRYQLVAATVELTTPKHISTSPGLFRIDTMTGRVSRYIAMTMPDGKTVEFMGPIEEQIEHLTKTLREKAKQN